MKVPNSTKNQSVIFSFNIIHFCKFAYILLIVLIVLPCIPAHRNLCHKMVWLTESNALLNSTKQRLVSSFIVFLFLRIVHNVYIYIRHERSESDLFCTKSVVTIKKCSKLRIKLDIFAYSASGLYSGIPWDLYSPFLLLEWMHYTTVLNWWYYPVCEAQVWY